MSIKGKRKFIPSISDINQQDTTVKYNKTVLPSGIRVVTENVPSVESFALGICINGGSRDETSEFAGTAHFLEHAVFRHSGSRNSHQIAAQLESLGAYSNAFTTKEITCYYIRALKQHFGKSFAVLADVVLNPKLRKSDVDKERRIIAEEVKSYMDDAEELIFDYGDQVLFKSHPLGNPIVGDLKSIKRINSEILAEFHKKIYHPGNIVVSVAGNISHDEVVEQVASLFSEINLPENPVIRLKPEPVEKSVLSEKMTFQQSHILFGRRVEGSTSPDRFKISAINVLFGDGMTSRLNKNLRESKSIAYSVYSSIQLYSDCGAFFVYAAADKRKSEKTKNLIREELNKLSNGKISKAELLRAKEQLKSSIIMDMESLSTRMQALAKNEFTTGGREHLPDVISSIDSIEIESIEELAQKLFNPDEWSEIIFLS